MDPLGTLLVMAAIICYILALQWGGTTRSWDDSSVIGTLVGFAILAILFGANEWYVGERALLPGSLICNRAIMANCLYIFFFAGSFFTLLYYLPLYFQSVDGVSASQSGYVSLVPTQLLPNSGVADMI